MSSGWWWQAAQHSAAPDPLDASGSGAELRRAGFGQPARCSMGCCPVQSGSVSALPDARLLRARRGLLVLAGSDRWAQSLRSPDRFTLLGGCIFSGFAWHLAVVALRVGTVRPGAGVSFTQHFRVKSLAETRSGRWSRLSEVTLDLAWRRFSLPGEPGIPGTRLSHTIPPPHAGRARPSTHRIRVPRCFRWLARPWGAPSAWLGARGCAPAACTRAARRPSVSYLLKASYHFNWFLYIK